MNGAIIILILGVWTNPVAIGRCETLFGGFVMEKLSNTRAIVFGGSDLDAGSAAAGSVYILDISILINTVVRIYSLIFHSHMHPDPIGIWSGPVKIPMATISCYYAC